jgi:hypothetical protein
MQNKSDVPIRTDVLIRPDVPIRDERPQSAFATFTIHRCGAVVHKLAVKER